MAEFSLLHCLVECSPLIARSQSGSPVENRSESPCVAKSTDPPDLRTRANWHGGQNYRLHVPANPSRSTGRLWSTTARHTL
jgi:hypothetical protein